MDRLSVVVAAMVVAMSVAVTVVMVGDGTPAARIQEDREWAFRVQDAEAALAGGQTQMAMIQLRAAHQAALRTGRWDAMVGVGDAARHVSEAVAPPSRAFATASRAYLAGLARAREQRSLEGVLRVAEGFAALGDREMVEYCIGVAGGLAGSAGSGEGMVRVQEFTERYRVLQASLREEMAE